MLPVRSSSGLKITRVTIAETNWRDAKQPPLVDLGGAELAPTVKLLDDHGVMSVPAFHMKDVYAVDGSSITIALELADGRYMTIAANNCEEPHICGFLIDAANTGLLDHVPQLCKKASWQNFSCVDR